MPNGAQQLVFKAVVSTAFLKMLKLSVSRCYRSLNESILTSAIVLLRYDNEMGYSNRVIDLIKYMQTKDH